MNHEEVPLKAVSIPDSHPVVGDAAPADGIRNGVSVSEMVAESAASWRHISTLRPWAKNADFKNVDPRDIADVAGMIKSVGFVAPIIEGTWPGLAEPRMVAGHTRLLAMESILASDPSFVARGAPGVGFVRVVLHTFASEAEADAYALADNRLQRTEWNEDNVGAYLAQLDEENRQLLGFRSDDEDVARMLEAQELLALPEIETVAEPAEPRALDTVPVVTGAWRIVHAQVLDALREIPSDSVDAILSDFPYGLGTHHPSGEELIAYMSGAADLNTGGDFMGRAWQIPSVAVHRELFRVLKPGGHMLGFAGARTQDLISMGMRCAGFEVRDVVMWMYVQAMPKSLDVGKAIDKAAGATREVIGFKPGVHVVEGNGGSGSKMAGVKKMQVTLPVTAPSTEDAKRWDGYGTGLKPSFEPAILCRKPLDGTVVQNIAKWGVGGLAINACRIPYANEEDQAAAQRMGQPHHGAGVGDFGLHGDNAPASLAESLAKQNGGRWPANMIMDGQASSILDEQSGVTRSAPYPENVAEGSVGVGRMSNRSAGGYSDTGGASRIFYKPKASTAERNRGLDHRPALPAGGLSGSHDGSLNGGRPMMAQNTHCAVKPVALTRYLATLLLPPPHKDGSPRRVLVPYSGSGSEIIGALLAGWDDVVGIEREPQKPGDPDYVGIAEDRIRHAVAFPEEWCTAYEETEDETADGEGDTVHE